MYNSPIRNNKLIQEAYEAGRRQALSEQTGNSPTGEKMPSWLSPDPTEQPAEQEVTPAKGEGMFPDVPVDVPDWWCGYCGCCDDGLGDWYYYQWLQDLLEGLGGYGNPGLPGGSWQQLLDMLRRAKNSNERESILEWLREMFLAWAEALGLTPEQLEWLWQQWNWGSHPYPRDDDGYLIIPVNWPSDQPWPPPLFPNPGDWGNPYDWENTQG